MDIKVRNVIDIKKNNIFAFWESHSEMPAYLKLCIETWHKNIPNAEVHIINYKNINDYIEGVYNLDKLKKIPLAMQSDIVSAAVLEKFGGLFLDIDSIVIANLFEIFDIISNDKLIAFGNERKAIHIAVLYSKKPHNKILSEWIKGAQDKLNKDIPSKLPWDYFGNSIVEPYFTNPEYYQYSYIVERAISGNILEADAMKEYDATNLMKYRFFYFNKIFRLKPEIMRLIKAGVVSLHNSWTPIQIKDIKDIDEFINTQMPIVDLLQYALSEKKETISLNNLVFIEAKILDGLDKESIKYRKRYYNGLLVLDFDVQGINFAIDIGDEQGLESYLIIRNQGNIEKYKKLNGLDFKENKAKIPNVRSGEDLLNYIIEIYKYYETQTFE